MKGYRVTNENLCIVYHNTFHLTYNMVTKPVTVWRFTLHLLQGLQYYNLIAISYFNKVYNEAWQYL